MSKLNQEIYERTEQWRNQPLHGEYPYVFLYGIVLKRSWAGEVRNVSVLVAISVNGDGYREMIGVPEGAKEDKAGWSSFLKHLKDRGLGGVQLVTSDKCIGLVESLAEFYPQARWQRCAVHFYRNVFSVVPKGKAREVAAMVHQDTQKTREYMNFPDEHWRHIRTNNPLERIMREIRRRTRVVGSFPDGNSALMLVAARLRHIAGTKWRTRRYLNAELLAKHPKAQEVG